MEKNPNIIINDNNYRKKQTLNYLKSKYKIRTKEQMLQLLKKYEEIFTKEILEYFCDLINLQYSVIQDVISKETRNTLSEFNIYKEIAKFNIYNKTIKLLKSKKFQIISNEDGLNGVVVVSEINNKPVKLFKFIYGVENFDSIYSIGNITLYQTLEDENLRFEELKKVIKELEKLEEEKNPYNKDDIFDKDSSNWAFDHLNKINEANKKINMLEKNELNSNKDEIEVTNQVYNLIIDDFGLKNKKFRLSQKQSDNSLKKILNYKLPYLNIDKKVTYL